MFTLTRLVLICASVCMTSAHAAVDPLQDADDLKDKRAALAAAAAKGDAPKVAPAGAAGASVGGGVGGAGGAAGETGAPKVAGPAARRRGRRGEHLNQADWDVIKKDYRVRRALWTRDRVLLGILKNKIRTQHTAFLKDSRFMNDLDSRVRAIDGAAVLFKDGKPLNMEYSDDVEAGGEELLACMEKDSDECGLADEIDPPVRVAEPTTATVCDGCREKDNLLRRQAAEIEALKDRLASLEVLRRTPIVPAPVPERPVLRGSGEGGLALMVALGPLLAALVNGRNGGNGQSGPRMPPGFFMRPGIPRGFGGPGGFARPGGAFAGAGGFGGLGGGGGGGRFPPVIAGPALGGTNGSLATYQPPLVGGNTIYNQGGFGYSQTPVWGQSGAPILAGSLNAPVIAGRAT